MGELSGTSRFIVTGGAGFIGRRLAARLARVHDCVYVVDMRHRPDCLPRNVHYVHADISDATSLRGLLSESTIVFHLAANSSTTKAILDPWSDLNTNAAGALTVLEACRSQGVRRLLYASSASVYGRPQSSRIRESHELHPTTPYGVSKLAGELYCRSYYATYRIPAVIVRPFCVYGPGEDPTNALVEVSRYLRWYISTGSVPIIGDAAAKTRDFVYVDDVVAALINLADTGIPSEAYNLGSGTETSMVQLVLEIAAMLEGSPTFTEDRTMLLDTYRLVANIDKLRSLGFAPRVSLQMGLRRVAAALETSPSPPSHPAILHADHQGEQV